MFTSWTLPIWAAAARRGTDGGGAGEKRGDSVGKAGVESDGGENSIVFFGWCIFHEPL
jgi:hypothetical protein